MGEIREGQKAKLSFKMADNSEKEFDCFIKEIQKDRLSLDFSQEILSYAQYLEEGTELPVKIFTPSGIKLFDSIILNSPLESEFTIEYTENSIQIQRRAYTRVDLKTKVIIERTERTNVVTHTIDISGGGLRFFYEGDFEPKERVKFLLYLPFEAHSVQAEGIIINNEHLQKNEHILYFTEIKERERDRIIKKCFEIEAGKYSNIKESDKI